MVVLSFEGWIRGAVGIGQFDVRIGNVNGRLRCFVVGAVGQCCLFQSYQASGYRRRDEIANDVKVSSGLLKAHESLQLVAGLD